MYTDINTVRTMSWLDDDVNITDQNIKDKITKACSMVNSSIWCVYTLPIKYRYDNTLTFSWPATGSWTMAVVVNGTTYNVSISNWDTAENVADKFRTAVENSDDFISDDLWLWAESTIISKTDSEDKSTAFAEVNITSAPDTSWITTVIGTRKKRYPQSLDQATAEVATALLFIDIYWVEGEDTGKDGENRMDRINNVLKSFQWVWDDNQRLKIFDDVTQVEIEESTNDQAESYPNDTSNEDPDDPTRPKAFMNKTF